MKFLKSLDWPLLIIWAALATAGLIAIYSATLGPVSEFLPGHIQENFYRQLTWIALSLAAIVALQYVPPRTFQGIAWPFYGFATILMIITIFAGTEVSGSSSWLRIGTINIQTGELMKLATILAAAHYLTGQRNTSASNLKTAFVTLLIFLNPIVILIFFQDETGVALVYLGLLPFMLFWAGLPHAITLLIISPVIIGYFSVINLVWGGVAAVIIALVILIIQRKFWLTTTALVAGLLTVIATEVVLHQVLQPHQTARVETFVNPNLDPQGTGWNIRQATTAIGSGGLTGKGFMEGTQTQLRFLPEQWTDFIFCVVGEEFGFVGAATILTLFLLLFLRLLQMATYHKYPFAQLFLVSVASVLFVHFTINIGSATAIMPIVGLPLPFMSYGGSSFLINSILLGICLNLDLYKRSLSIYR